MQGTQRSASELCVATTRARTAPSACSASRRCALSAEQAAMTTPRRALTSIVVKAGRESEQESSKCFVFPQSCAPMAADEEDKPNMR